MAAGTVTELLLAWRAGDEPALARLTPLVHDELQRIARRCMRGERPGTACRRRRWSTRPTCGWSTRGRCDWQNRAHFLAMAARLMRRILVDARAAKRLPEARRGRRAGDARRRRCSAPASTSHGPRRARRCAARRWPTIDERKSRGRRAAVLRRAERRGDGRGARKSPRDTVMRDWKLARRGCCVSSRDAATRWTPERWQPDRRALSRGAGASGGRARRVSARGRAAATRRCGARCESLLDQPVSRGRVLDAGAGARDDGDRRALGPDGPAARRLSSCRSCSAPAGWARSIARATRGSAATSRSRSCPRASRTIPTGSRASSVKRGSLAALNHPQHRRDLRRRGAGARHRRRPRAGTGRTARRWPSGIGARAARRCRRRSRSPRADRRRPRGRARAGASSTAI